VFGRQHNIDRITNVRRRREGVHHRLMSYVLSSKFVLGTVLANGIVHLKHLYFRLLEVLAEQAMKTLFGFCMQSNVSLKFIKLANLSVVCTCRFMAVLSVFQ
jgi:hypothetical protein